MRKVIYSFFTVISILTFASFADAGSSGDPLQDAIRVARKYLEVDRDFAPHEVEKCFTDGFSTLAKNWDRLSPTLQKEFSGIFARPGVAGTGYGSVNLPNKFYTPHFKIHYTKEGKHAPPLEDFHPRNGVPDYIDIAADALERSYRLIVENMNYRPPRDDFWVKGNGGDQKEDVYFFKFGSLGLTTADWYNGRVISAGATFGPFYLINSRMWDYYGRSEGIRYIETTIAHEYFHGIQFGYNNAMPAWVMESSATWMESKAYDADRRVIDFPITFEAELNDGTISEDFKKILHNNQIYFYSDQVDLGGFSEQLERLRTSENIDLKFEEVTVAKNPDGRSWKIFDPSPIFITHPITGEKVRNHTKNQSYLIKKVKDDKIAQDKLEFHEDFDDVWEPDNISETEAYHYFTGQLQKWLLIPDVSLDDTSGVHEYGSMIWIFYITERFETDIVRKFYASTTGGASSEFGNFGKLFEDYGTTLIEAFKTFTVWNYFTGDRDDGQHYFNANRFVSVAISPTDIHKNYPVQVDLTDDMPEHFSSRYVIFNPPKGEVIEKFSVKVDGFDLAPPDLSAFSAMPERTDVQPKTLEEIQSELKRVDSAGLRGWGAKFVVHKSDGSTEVREAFTFHRSQVGQVNFEDFGGDITKIALIIVNANGGKEHAVTPDYDTRTGENFKRGGISYFAGVPPAGKLSEPIASRGENSEILVEWELEEISGIREIAVVRKRFASINKNDTLETFRSELDVLNATDRDDNGIPDGDINIVGWVNATDRFFVDKTAFLDVNTEKSSFNPNAVAYFYAVVPIGENGIMGTPSFSKKFVVPEYIPRDAMAEAPANARLLQSYPNPFNPETWIPFELSKSSDVTVEVYNSSGELIRSLAIGNRSAGKYLSRDLAVHWDGRTERGEMAASGIYFYVMKTGDFVSTKKMVLLK